MVETKAANEQHYEVPAEFYKLCLSPRLKYSSCFYETGTESISQAEETMLTKSCEPVEAEADATFVSSAGGKSRMADESKLGDDIVTCDDENYRRFMLPRSVRMGATLLGRGARRV